MSDFYDFRASAWTRKTTLEAGEFISAIVLPGASAGGVQRYHKLMQREAWDFALVSVAGCKRPMATCGSCSAAWRRGRGA